MGAGSVANSYGFRRPVTGSVGHYPPDDPTVGVSDDFGAGDPSEMGRAELAAALHTHLAATAELPIDPTANRWLGEAQAVAADVADGSAPDAVVTKRARQVVHLLENAGDLDNDEAGRHVDAALAVARELVARGGSD